MTDRDKDLCLGNCGIITKWLSILELLLGDGAVKVSDVHDIMSEKGISDETAQRARERIGAVQEYVDGIAVWRIPE